MAADQILSSLVGKLVDYVAVPVGRQFSYLFRYNGNWEEFRRQREGLETAAGDVKLRVEAAERNGEVIFRRVEDWLKTVEAVIVESQPFVGEEDAISKSCFNGPLNLKVRYQRSRKAKKKATEFDRINKDGIFNVVSAPAPPPPIRAMNKENEFDFESRKSVFNEIIDAIKDDGVDMIGIWGMPGIGKTTLVKRVAKFAKDEGLFEVVAMAVVSQNLSVKDVRGQIADKIGLKFTSENEEGRADELFQRLLAMKKILVILDDIWEYLELNDIGIPSGSQHKGCKIILTSRKRGVCEEMRSGKNFKIDLLSANEALSLFLQMSGIDNRCSEKGRLAENLSEECGRLPVCIVIVARGLLNKEESHWTDRLNRLRNSDPDSKVRDAIELSYKGEKREEEKTFFLLCALFPEDYEIPVRELLEYGIGLDLFEKVDNVDEALVRAHKLASSLKSSSLLLDAGSEEHVKMHDVVRDAALAIASEGKHAFLVRSAAPWREWSEKRAISLWSDDVKKLPDGLECPQLQILLLNFMYRNLQLPDNFFVGMRNLIVLDMFEMKFVRLPESFAGLENLRTLALRFCDIEDISTIGKLQNLVSLSFWGSNIEVLPKEVGELSNLTLLDLSGCVGLKAITPGVIQNLSQLEALLMWNQKNAFDSELKHLSRLKILEIQIPDASMLPDDVLLGNLTKFNIFIGRGLYVWRFPDFCLSSQILRLKRISENEVTEAGIKTLMKKAQHLELLNVSGISVALPSHLGGLRTLKVLNVSDCKDVNYVLDVSESEYEHETTSLQQLHLINLPSLKEISRGKFLSMFVSKLKHFRLDTLPSLVHLWQFPAESVALTNLTTMQVKSCDELKYVLEQSTARSLLKLKELEVEYCKNLEAIYLTKEEEQDNVMDFPQLSNFKLSGLENLTSFGSKFTSESTLFGKEVWCINENLKLKTKNTPSRQDYEFTLKFKSMILYFLMLLCFAFLFSIVVEEENFNMTISSNSSTNQKKVSRVNFCALERLDINNLEKLEKIWHVHSPAESFFHLKVLKLTKCSELLVVFPSQATSTLRNLKEICIENCDKLETLVQVQSNDVPLTVSDQMILFPRLLTLKLINLLKFTIILSTSSQNISQSTVLFGRLSHLELERVELIEEIWHRDLPSTTVGELHVLRVKCCDRLLKIFSSNLLAGLQNLENLHVQSCLSLEHVFAIEDHPPFLSSLEHLELYNLPKLNQLWWNENTCESFGLPRLKFFRMENCPALQYVFDASVANHLENLKSLLVANCSSIVEIVDEKPGRKIMFPLLNTLYLENLPCFKGLNQYVEFPQVKDVVVDRCLNIKEPHQVNVEHVRNIQLHGSMSFFESLVECWKTDMVTRLTIIEESDSCEEEEEESST